MRPPGEIRRALSRAAHQLAAERGGATWRDMAVASQVGYAQACRTVRNMERAGELLAVGAEKRAHSRRWMTLFAPSAAPASHARDAGQALDELLRGWGAGSAGAQGRAGVSDHATEVRMQTMPSGP